MSAVVSDRRALLNATCYAASCRHEVAIQLASDYLIRSTAFQRDRRSQLAAFFLCRRIADKLADGCLPLKRAAVVAGAPSNGVGSCDACGSPFDRRQLAMEVPTPRGGSVRLHADCFVLWDDVRRRVG